MPDIPTIYIAGSSHELERVEQASEALARLGYCVLSDWPSTIRRAREQGYSSDRALPREFRRNAASHDSEMVSEASMFWLLVPREPRSSIGAWVELGLSLGWTEKIVVSGDCDATIFLELAHFRFPTDAEALDWFRTEVRR